MVYASAIMSDQQPPEFSDPFQDPIPTSEFSQAIEPEHPHWSLWLPYLFVRPQLFFQTFVLRSIPVLTVLTAWLYGVASVLDQIGPQGDLYGGENPISDLIAQNWTIYWIFAALMGILGGVCLRDRRLVVPPAPELVRRRQPDPYLARRVYIFSAQAYVIPYLLYTAWEVTAYPNPAAAAAGDDLTSITIVAAMFWSVYVSYRGVRTAFDVRRWAARIWFAILPTAVYAVVFGAVVAASLMTDLLVSAPDLQNTQRIEREGFALNYPGNWEVDRIDEDYDPDGNFAIEPPVADALIRFSFYEEAMDSQDCVDQTRDNLSDAYTLSDLIGVDHWGDYDGAGYLGSVNIMLGDYDILIFCSTERARPFEIFQIVEENAADKLQPGFDLMRNSLELYPVEERLPSFLPRNPEPKGGAMNDREQTNESVPTEKEAAETRLLTTGCSQTIANGRRRGPSRRPPLGARHPDHCHPGDPCRSVIAPGVSYPGLGFGRDPDPRLPSPPRCLAGPRQPGPDHRLPFPRRSTPSPALPGGPGRSVYPARRVLAQDGLDPHHPGAAHRRLPGTAATKVRAGHADRAHRRHRGGVDTAPRSRARHRPQAVRSSAAEPGTRCRLRLAG